jgi:hypothetical protein
MEEAKGSPFKSDIRVFKMPELIYDWIESK